MEVKPDQIVEKEEIVEEGDKPKEDKKEEEVKQEEDAAVKPKINYTMLKVLVGQNKVFEDI